MTDHEELVAEMASVERMPIAERLKLAKKRRAMQLKAYTQYQKQVNKEDRKSKKSATEAAHKSSQLRFADSILLLDAAGKNDLVEGNDDEFCVQYSASVEIGN